jgi:hypothetical protein
VQYVSTLGNDGLYRKYGVFGIRGRMVPQNLMTAESWVVKSDSRDPDADMTEEEERFVTTNPHADQLREVFRIAHIDFGRVDYGIVNGRIEVFEINTNPTFSRARITQDRKMIRRKLTIEGLVAGFRDLDAGAHGTGVVRFRTPKPKLHRLRNRGWSRRIKDRIAYWRWWTDSMRTRSQRAVEHRQPQPEAK